MRNVEYLSPSSIDTWNKNPDDFYLRYLAVDRPPREPQNQPMSIGSAFDAYVKSYLHDKLFGRGHSNSNRFELATIFEAQVEEHNRDWALTHGKYAFECYKKSGALLDLLGDMHSAKGEARFEFEVRGAVNGHREGTQQDFVSVVLLGKPDAYFVNSEGVGVILDWKVNGYCSNYPQSPMKGYTRLRGGDGRWYGMHKDCALHKVAGMDINIGDTLDNLKPDWARQLAIYAWLLDQPIGGDFIVAIDQLICNPPKGSETGRSIRVAEHRLRIAKDFQLRQFAYACELWEIIHSDHIFRHMTKEDSAGRCQLLDQQAEALYGQNADPDFAAFTRR